jgi:hypothetical protein
MDPITTAIVAALGAGAISGLTEASKTAIADAYGRLKTLLGKKFGGDSEVVQAVNQLEVKPTSSGRKETLAEEIAAVHAEQDEEIQSLVAHMLTLVQSESSGQGKFIIQNNAPVQGQNIGDYQQITQQFGHPPEG